MLTVNHQRKSLRRRFIRELRDTAIDANMSMPEMLSFYDGLDELSLAEIVIHDSQGTFDGFALLQEMDIHEYALQASGYSLSARIHYALDSYFDDYEVHRIKIDGRLRVVFIPHAHVIPDVFYL